MLHTVRQAESGTPVAEVCRKLGITEQTFYKWKRWVAGMGEATQYGRTAKTAARTVTSQED
jgi:transposase-like protein